VALRFTEIAHASANRLLRYPNEHELSSDTEQGRCQHICPVLVQVRIGYETRLRFCAPRNDAGARDAGAQVAGPMFSA
jgi:hypothetical protein